MPIKFEPEEIKPKKITTKQIMCSHHKLIADEALRTLKCEICNTFIEPFDYILNKAKRQQVLFFRIGELQKEERQLLLSIADLKKQKKNLKAYIKKKSRI